MAPIGLVYLVRVVIPRQILPPLIAYGILKLSAARLGHHWPTWSTLLAALLTYPLYILLSSIYSNVRNRREAAARGAVLAPRVELSSLATVKAITESFAKGYPGDVYLEWSKKYGNTFSVNIPGEPRIITTEPEHIKAILATQFESFVKGPVLFDQFGSLLGSGVFNSDGEMWKFHRNMTRPFFTKERLSDFDVFDRHANDVIALMKARIADGHAIDFQDAVSRFTLDSATEFLFGKDVNSLSAGLPYPPYSPLSNDPAFENHPSNVFAKAFLEGQELTAMRTRYGTQWRLKEFWEDVVGKRRLIVNRFVDPILEDAKARKRSKDLEDGAGETFLDHLIEHTEDKQVLQDELLNILVASRDTTASLLTFAVYILTQRPDIFARLTLELAETVGGGRPTYQQIREMKYLRAFLNETLRLYPSVPFNARTSVAPTVLSSKNGVPIYVPKGTKVNYSVFLMHRRQDLWGSDALNFDPDRFIDERLKKYLTPNPYIFVPFNAGPRICLGQQFAYNEASFFLIKFLQNFSDISFAEDVQPNSVKPPAEWVRDQTEGRLTGTTKGRDKFMFLNHLTMGIKGGLWIRMKKVEEK